MLCVLILIHMWRDLQFEVYSERQIFFEKLETTELRKSNDTQWKLVLIQQQRNFEKKQNETTQSEVWVYVN